MPWFFFVDNVPYRVYNAPKGNNNLKGHMMIDPLTTEVRQAIAHARARHNVTTNKQLAQRLGILPKHLSKWQNGHFTNLDRVLVALLLERQKPERVA